MTTPDEATIKRIMQAVIELEKENIRTNDKAFGQMVQCIKNEIRKEIEPLYDGSTPIEGSS